MSILKSRQGLILIELITVIVLIGLIAAFTTFFLYSGIDGYLDIKNRAEGSLNAQTALDRISIELRDLNYFTSFTANSSLTFTNEVISGTRGLSFNSNAIWISIGSTPYKLLENVDSFILSKTARDLNNDGSDEVAFFEVGFRVSDINRDLKTRIFPRYMVKDK